MTNNVKKIRKSYERNSEILEKILLNLSKEIGIDNELRHGEAWDEMKKKYAEPEENLTKMQKVLRWLKTH